MLPDFRFQTILNYRKRTEDERQMELAQALQTVASLRAQRERLQSERLRLAEMLKGLLAGQLDTTGIERSYRYLNSLDQQLFHLADDAQRAEQAVAERRHHLAEAVKDRKTMERLKEYDRQVFVAAYSQKEQEEMDELNVARYSTRE